MIETFTVTETPNASKVKKKLATEKMHMSGARCQCLKDCGIFKSYIKSFILK